MVIKEVSCEDERWMELAQYCVQWWGVVLAVLSLRIYYNNECSM